MTQLDIIEEEVGALLAELATVQQELFALLAEKKQRILDDDSEGWKNLESHEAELSARLEACQTKRGELLKQAAENGLPGDTLQTLTAHMPSDRGQKLQAEVVASRHRMRLLQSDSISSWVVAQRSLLHVSQILEIYATGGRMQPTYKQMESNRNEGSRAGGAIVDREA